MEDYWEEVPSHVMLVGTATYNHKKYENFDFIPVKTFQHYRYGAVTSDYSYSVRENSILPQFYIGRIPCSTNEQLSNYLRKIYSYENAKNENIVYYKRLRTLNIVTDSLIYNNLENIVNNNFPKTRFLDRLLLWKTSGPYEGSTATLLEKMDMGLGVLNYFGHGAGEIWANSRLLLPSDIDKLNKNNFLPVIYSWTCFGANFASRTKDNDLGLTEKMIFTNKKGGVAAISASGNTTFSNNFEIYSEVLAAKQERYNTLGEMFTITKLIFIKIILIGTIMKERKIYFNFQFLEIQH